MEFVNDGLYWIYSYAKGFMVSRKGRRVKKIVAFDMSWSMALWALGETAEYHQSTYNWGPINRQTNKWYWGHLYMKTNKTYCVCLFFFADHLGTSWCIHWSIWLSENLPFKHMTPHPSMYQQDGYSRFQLWVGWISRNLLILGILVIIHSPVHYKINIP